MSKTIRRKSPRSVARAASHQDDTSPRKYIADSARSSAGSRSSESRVVLINKPWGVLSQFTPEGGHPCLAEFGLPGGIYAAGRLDRDSEGLLVLTNDGALQARISHPRQKWPKVYAVQVEGVPDADALQALREGVRLKDGLTTPAQVEPLPDPEFWQRDPPVRERKSIPTSWLRIVLREGRNRQVRRMTAHVGLPTLRLIRTQVGPLSLQGQQPGEWQALSSASITELRRWQPAQFKPM